MNMVWVESLQCFCVSEDGNHWDVRNQCGRPLGMRFDLKGKLVVADAILGIIRVDVDKGNLRKKQNSCEIVVTELSLECLIYDFYTQALLRL